MKNIKKYIYLTIALPIYYLSYLSPRNKKIWIFGSCDGNHIADNPYYFFKHCTSLSDDIKKFYITKNKKHINEQIPEYIYYLSFKGIYYSLRAKYFFLSHSIQDTNYFLTGGAKIIQLWHGIPLKKIGDDTGARTPSIRDSIIRSIKKLAFLVLSPFRYNRCNYLLNPSRITADIFSSAFRSSAPELIDGLQPRLDALHYRPIRSANETLRICWLPTHRKSSGTFKNSTSSFLTGKDFESLINYLEKNRDILYIKPHPIDVDDIASSIPKSDSIIIVQEVDPYPLIDSCDILITDYSSIYFDFLKTGRPIIFTPFDLSDYINNVSELYFDYQSITPGEKCQNWEELILHIDKLRNGNDNYQERRAQLDQKLHHDHENIGASEKFYIEFKRREKIL